MAFFFAHNLGVYIYIQCIVIHNVIIYFFWSFVYPYCLTGQDAGKNKETNMLLEEGSSPKPASQEESVEFVDKMCPVQAGMSVREARRSADVSNKIFG